jgi:hypothetical protein
MGNIETGAKYIDIREVIARVEQLEVLRQPGPVDTGNPDDAEEAQDDLFAELAKLEALLADLKGYGGDEQWRGDWYPVTLISDDAFVDYCQESLEDWGVISKELPSFVEIDWEKTADNMRVDYGTVDFDGVEYLYR